MTADPCGDSWLAAENQLWAAHGGRWFIPTSPPSSPSKIVKYSDSHSIEEGFRSEPCETIIIQLLSVWSAADATVAIAVTNIAADRFNRAHGISREQLIVVARNQLLATEALYLHVVAMFYNNIPADLSMQSSSAVCTVQDDQQKPWEQLTRLCCGEIFWFRRENNICESFQIQDRKSPSEMIIIVQDTTTPTGPDWKFYKSSQLIR